MNLKFENLSYHIITVSYRVCGSPNNAAPPAALNLIFNLMASPRCQFAIKSGREMEAARSLSVDWLAVCLVLCQTLTQYCHREECCTSTLSVLTPDMSGSVEKLLLLLSLSRWVYLVATDRILSVTPVCLKNQN